MSRRAVAAFSLLSLGWVSLCAAAGIAWGAAAATAVAGLGALAAGAVLLYAETSPGEGSPAEGDGKT